jgi:hypothetical protein
MVRRYDAGGAVCPALALNFAPSTSGTPHASLTIMTFENMCAMAFSDRARHAMSVMAELARTPQAIAVAGAADLPIPAP